MAAAKKTTTKKTNKKTAPVAVELLPETPKGMRAFLPAVNKARGVLASKFTEHAAALVSVKDQPVATHAAVDKVVQERIGVVEKPQVMECDYCGSTSTDETDFCPYCGEGDPELEELRNKEKAAADAAQVPEVEATAGADLATTQETPGTALASADALEMLTKAEGEIRQLEHDIKTNGFRLGKAILTVHEGELWKARGFKSFADWVEKETNVGRGYAYDLMEATKAFDEETFLKVGPGKLIPMLAVKDHGERESILDDAKAGASARLVREKVKAASSTKKKAPKKEPAAKRDVPAKEDGITLLAKVNGKATSYPFRGHETGRALKAYQEGAYAEIEISKGVRQRIALRRDKKTNEILGIEVAFVNVAKK